MSPRDQRFCGNPIRAAAAALGWAGAEWTRKGKPSVLGGISGAVAGVVAITPAAGFVQPMTALAIGLIARCLPLRDGSQGEGNVGV